MDATEGHVRVSAFETWKGDELAFLVEQLESLCAANRGEDDLERVEFFQEHAADFWAWYRASLIEAGEAYVARRELELDRAKTKRLEIDVRLGLIGENA